MKLERAGNQLGDFNEFRRIPLHEIRKLDKFHHPRAQDSHRPRYDFNVPLYFIFLSNGEMRKKYMPWKWI